MDNNSEVELPIARFFARRSPYNFPSEIVIPTQKFMDKARSVSKPKRTRINANSPDFNKEKQEVLKEAINKLISNGQYAELISIHTNGENTIHSIWDPVRLNERFLPWHRAYLKIFEDALNMVMDFQYDISIPYWDWTKDHEIPFWLVDFKPEIKQVKRFDSKIPYFDDIKVKRFPGKYLDNDSGQIIDIPLPTNENLDPARNKMDYKEFSLELEGNTHGWIHIWVGGVNPSNPSEGGTMSEFISPADPIFWIHHANIDRIWYEWQIDPRRTGDPNESPHLDVNAVDVWYSAKMYPWPEILEEHTRNIIDLNYTYG